MRGTDVAALCFWILKQNYMSSAEVIQVYIIPLLYDSIMGFVSCRHKSNITLCVTFKNSKILIISKKMGRSYQIYQ